MASISIDWTRLGRCPALQPPSSGFLTVTSCLDLEHRSFLPFSAIGRARDIKPGFSWPRSTKISLGWVGGLSPITAYTRRLSGGIVWFCLHSLSLCSCCHDSHAYSSVAGGAGRCSLPPRQNDRTSALPSHPGLFPLVPVTEAALRWHL